MKFLPSFLLLSVLSSSLQGQEPILNSWLTDFSHQYARVYESAADQDAQNAVSTWSLGSGTQDEPVYSDVNEISYSDDWVYILHSGLASHVMGPWYFDEDDSQVFANFPSNQNRLYRVSRHPVAETGTLTTTSAGLNGIYVNGVSLFDMTDTFSYDTSAGYDATTEDQNDPDGNGVANDHGVVTGDGVWNRDAVVNEFVTLDPAYAHQAGSNYHYHSSPSGLRHQLGDSVDYDSAANSYTENFNGSHSPIIGWAADGFPLYGPYGYSDPTDASSEVRRMVTGFQKRDGTHGSTDLASTGRTTLPDWALDYQDRSSTTLSSTEYGPAVDSLINYDVYDEEFEVAVLGRYLEDYTYKGDLIGLDFYDGVATDGAFVEGTHYDLNVHNGRFCVTPEFPEGIFAYFISIDSEGSPAFPYVLGHQFYGEVTAESVTSIDEEVTEYFSFEESFEESLESIAKVSDTVTVTWNAIEGGIYTVESSLTLDEDWQDEVTAEESEGGVLAFEDAGILSAEEKKFYRLTRTGLSDYEEIVPSDDGGLVGPGGPGDGLPPFLP